MISRISKSFNDSSPTLHPSIPKSIYFNSFFELFIFIFFWFFSSHLPPRGCGCFGSHFPTLGLHPLPPVYSTGQVHTDPLLFTCLPRQHVHGRSALYELSETRLVTRIFHTRHKLLFTTNHECPILGHYRICVSKYLCLSSWPHPRSQR
jgi:hypothetical protein